MLLPPARRRRRQFGEGHANTVSNVGWLFADLLLVLTILFVSTTTVGLIVLYEATRSEVPINDAKTPLRSLDPPTATPLPRLTTKPVTFDIVVDYVGLLNDDPTANANAQKAVKQRTDQSRRAGLVIVYGGAPTAGDTGKALAIARKVNLLLDNLGKQRWVFIETTYHDPLFTLGNDFSIATIEVYYFQ